MRTITMCRVKVEIKYPSKSPNINVVSTFMISKFQASGAISMKDNLSGNDQPSNVDTYSDSMHSNHPQMITISLYIIVDVHRAGCSHTRCTNKNKVTFLFSVSCFQPLYFISMFVVLFTKNKVQNFFIRDLNAD